MFAAPSIYEHNDVKKGILCLLFGGTTKDDENTHKTKLRSEVGAKLNQRFVNLSLVC